ncbi:hypothetical protein NUW54_g12657 [Trametes sanguinea]|uniref:Uncharacterized protein n=1 Tax=Trametes sanguinea TaxID=158606 RepID=A0ACC1MUT9_9APHY|nr:hypothetical protein NUW54_g12657 [Trametes sanguinea]
MYSQPSLHKVGRDAEAGIDDTTENYKQKGSGGSGYGRGLTSNYAQVSVADTSHIPRNNSTEARAQTA